METPQTGNQDTSTFTKGSLTKAVIASCCIIGAVYFWIRHAGFLSLSAWVLVYVAVLLLLQVFAGNSVARKILKVYATPANVLLRLGPVIYALSSIMIAYIITLALAILVVWLIPYLFPRISFSYSSRLYLILTATSIFATTIGDWLIKLLHSNKGKRELYDALSLKIIDQRKARCLIFAIYFVLLLVCTVASLNSISLFSANEIEKAILQSFATFVAYDRIISNWDSLTGEKQKK